MLEKRTKFYLHVAQGQGVRSSPLALRGLSHALTLSITMTFQDLLFLSYHSHPNGKQKQKTP